jgi:hypothetical protein
MKNNIFLNYIERMSKQNLYALAGNLSTEIGRQRQGGWRGTTTEYWKRQVVALQKNIKNRANNFRQALQISENLRVPLNFPHIIHGTDNELWNREKRRMRKRAKDAEKRTITIVRRQALPVLRDIVQRPARQQALPLLQEIQESRKTLSHIRQQRRARLIKRQLKLRVKAIKTKNKFDQLINNNQFQQVLNIVVNKNKVLTGQQAQLFWNNLRGNNRYSLTIDINDGRNQTVAVNETTKDFIVGLLLSGVVETNVPTWGSDILDTIIFDTILSLTLNIIPRPVRVMPDRDGRFFPFINTTNLDLLNYQIFTQENAYDKKLLSHREHCILFALKKCGVSTTLINQVKMAFISGCNIRKKDLKKIATMIKRNIIVNRMKPNGQIEKTTVKATGENLDEDIEIAIYENHYFKFETTIYSKYFINNYETLSHIDGKENIIKCIVKNGKTYMTKDKNKSKIDSLRLVDKLFKQEYFKKLDLVKFDETATHTELKEHIYLNNIENEQKEMESQKEEEKEIAPVYYADCESFVKGVENHELQLLGVVSDKSDMVNIYDVCDPIFQGKDICKEQLVVYEFLNTLTKGGKQNALCYFHFLKYDYHVIEKYLNIKKKCEKDKQIYNVVVMYKGREIELRDSCKIIPFTLAKFQKEFNLPKEFGKKEAIAYDYYSIENHNKTIPTANYTKLLPKSEQVIFKANMFNEPSYDREKKTFNPLTYYKEYLRLDCLVLKKGIQKMDSLIKEITEGKMSVYECLTISSLTDKYMIKEGAYDGVYSMQGNLRAYVAEAVYGGRVCVNPKYKKKIIEGKISDYDGVSLYPSAINRLCREIGLPIGKAKQITNMNDWEQYTYSILTVKINKVNKIQQMPFIAHKSDTSIKYSNEPPPEPITIDSITLQDYIKFHEIEYEILDGVYWNEGGNKKMGEVIQRLFEARLKYKKSNVALANTIKLMLNSAYGKTIMKKTMTETKIIKTSKKRFNKKTKKWEDVKKTPFMDYVYNNFNTIKRYRQLNADNWEVERICSDNSYNRGHIGCAILSMSKRIMNEVFDTANTNELPIYYTDTDSIHCNLADVPTLEAKYKEAYNKELNGKNLEQFHTDFNMLDKDNKPRQGDNEEIYATKSIFLGKKSYMDVLESKDKDGNTITGTHIRLKGITEAGLEHVSKEYEDGYFGLYSDLAKGTRKKIILNPFNAEENKHKVLFEFKDGRVKTRKEFSREVSF